MSRSPHLAGILGHPERNGIYRLDDDVKLGDCFYIAGKRLTDKEAMLGALSEALSFPDYFGFNWDAVEECLADLSWHEGDVVLLIDDAATPERISPSSWGDMLDVLRDAARFWKSEGRPFAVFLRGGHAAYPVVAS